MHKVRDSKGAVLEVGTKEQAAQWVAVGYSLVEDEKPKSKTTAKKSAPAAKK